ncbi:MAG: hypothetical protein ABW032_12570 [Burkholderiaceae bacterium]
MSGQPRVKERYSKGPLEVIFYIVYDRTGGPGVDVVLEHKIAGRQSAHITLHPDDLPRFRETRTRKYLVEAVDNQMAGFEPALSDGLRAFLSKIRGRVVFDG